jgi:ribosome-associated toxin RatA of RatAB toxin-antitoxin module
MDGKLTNLEPRNRIGVLHRGVPRIEAKCSVPVSADLAFALSQTYGELRYRWDPFVHHQELLNGAHRAGAGVQTLTRSKHKLTMITEYQSFRPPSHVGMKMVSGPWFFQTFSGGWNFLATTDNETAVTWRYNFVVKPAFLRPIADRIGTYVLQRDINRRLAAFANACRDQSILKEVQPFTS